MSDIYGVEDYIKRTRKLLKHSNMSGSNKCYLDNWIDYLLSENDVGDKKISRYVQTFRVLSAQGAIDFDLKDADEKDLRKLVGKINSNRVKGKHYAPESRAELKKAIRKFYQFVHREEEPEIIDFISTQVKKSNQEELDISSLPTPHTVVDMYHCSKNLRDKAFLLTLWESGARIGELLELTWSDITDKGTLLTLYLTGKTGGRSVPVVDCKPILMQWKEQQESSTDYVFTSFHGGNQMSYGGARKRLRVMAERADVERDHNPHAFRKSRATYMAHQGANVFQLMKMFGWSQIETAKQYVQTARGRVDNLVIEYSSHDEEEFDDSLGSGSQQWDKSPVEALELKDSPR